MYITLHRLLDNEFDIEDSLSNSTYISTTCTKKSWPLVSKKQIKRISSILFNRFAILALSLEKQFENTKKGNEKLKLKYSQYNEQNTKDKQL
jgi:hypothetical protein